MHPAPSPRRRAPRRGPAQERPARTPFALPLSRHPRRARHAGLAVGGAVAALALSGCSAGQITQTQPEFGRQVGIGQDSAAQGITERMITDAITLSNVQLVLATPQALRDHNPFHLVFDAANASPDTDFRIEEITVAGTPVTIEGGPALLCAGGAVTTRTPRQIQAEVTGSTPPTGTAPVQPADRSCSAPQGTVLESLSRIGLGAVTLPGEHRPGTSVDVTFRVSGAEPVTIPVPVTVPVYWDRADAR